MSTFGFAKVFVKSESHAQESVCKDYISIHIFLLYSKLCIVCKTTYTLGKTMRRFFQIASKCYFILEKMAMAILSVFVYDLELVFCGGSRNFIFITKTFKVFIIQDSVGEPLDPLLEFFVAKRSISDVKRLLIPPQVFT